MAAGLFPFKGLLAHGSTRTKFMLAALLLVFVWVLGPRTLQGSAQQAHALTAKPYAPQKSTLEALKDLASAVKPAARPAASAPEGTEPSLVASSPADLVLSADAAETFCFHHHLAAYNGSLSSSSSSSASSSDGYHHRQAPPQAGSSSSGRNTRRIYDLLLITPTTSSEMLELRLASMYAYVDYFILLEVPPSPASPVAAKSNSKNSKSPAGDANSPSYAETPEPPTLLDVLWNRLRPYHSRLIRHTLSQHSHDFKTGLDYTATTRNALYTRVIPLLTGAQKVRLGDVLLISDVEELVRPVTLSVLRNCHVPERTTVRTRKYWYSFQWMKIDGLGTTPPSPLTGPVLVDPNLPVHPDHAGTAAKNAVQGNEWWPHPQATVFQGADTILPDDLRKQRSQDEYVFGDGGWTCHLCYASISETLAKMGEAGVIWFDGPKWKAAGRVVLRMMKGIDMYDRTHLARIESNPDIPPHLASNPSRYKWLLDRDVLGANFDDFVAADLERYLAKKKQVDSEPDFERPLPGVDYVLGNTGDASYVGPATGSAVAPAGLDASGGGRGGAGQSPPPVAGANVEPPPPDSPPPPVVETDWRDAPLNYVVAESAEEKASHEDPSSSGDDGQDNADEKQGDADEANDANREERQGDGESPQESDADSSS